MDQALVISNLLLWIVVLILAVLIVALVRQIGVLHERVAPAGALMVGSALKAGEQAPVLEVEDLAGGLHEIGGTNPDGRSVLIFFLSPTCPVCKTLLPAVRAIARSETDWLRVLLASDGPRREHEAYVRDHDLTDLPYVVSAELGVRFGVGRLPHGVLVDEHGVVRAQGLVNTREHLESLFEARERGVASIQEYIAGTGGGEPR